LIASAKEAPISPTPSIATLSKCIAERLLMH
jgi:hypothetical protein